MISKETKRKIKYFVVLTVWIFAYFVYIIIGGYVITYLEQENDVSLKLEKKTKFLATLKKHKYSFNNTKIMEIIESAIEAYNHDVLNPHGIENITSAWSLSTGIFFCNTLVTTIGYGNMYPRTRTGRLFTVVYALFGISITGIVLIKIGAGLRQVIKKSDAFWEKQVMKFKKTIENPKLTVHITQLVITFLTALFIIWVIPAIVLVKMEGWDFGTASYFTFITMTTIGLGDITPGQTSDGGPLTSKEKLYQYCSILYILLGLASVTVLLKMVDSLVKTISEKMANQAEDLFKQAIEVYEPDDLNDPQSKSCHSNTSDDISLSSNGEHSNDTQYTEKTKTTKACNNEIMKKNRQQNKPKATSRYKEESKGNTITTNKNKYQVEVEEKELREKVVHIYSHVAATHILKCCSFEKSNIETDRIQPRQNFDDILYEST